MSGKDGRVKRKCSRRCGQRTACPTTTLLEKCCQRFDRQRDVMEGGMCVERDPTYAGQTTRHSVILRHTWRNRRIAPAVFIGCSSYYHVVAHGIIHVTVCLNICVLSF